MVEDVCMKLAPDKKPKAYTLEPHLDEEDAILVARCKRVRQGRVAEQMGVHQANLSQWLNGRRPITEAHLRTLRAAVDMLEARQ